MVDFDVIVASKSIYNEKYRMSIGGIGQHVYTGLRGGEFIFQTPFVKMSKSIQH